MHHGSVPDAHIVLDRQGFAVRRVEDRSVLDGYAPPDSNRGDIATDHDIVHDRHLIAKHDVTSDVGRRRHEDVPAEPGWCRWIIHAYSFYELREGNAKGLACGLSKRSLGCNRNTKNENI